MAPPYSERFLAEKLDADTFSSSYAVPIGKRAIISCLTFTSTDSTPGVGALVLDPAGLGVILIGVELLNNVPVTFDGLHIVCYAGEEFVMGCFITSADVSASGYLLSDP